MTAVTHPLPRADRPVFFSGQLLAADDLNAESDVDHGLRHLHHRMLHGWGIAAGLAVTGARGGTEVTLAAGYALDAGGRELVVPDPTPVPVPPVSAAPDGGPIDFTLILRWTSDPDAVVIDRPGACGAEGAVRRSDAPTIAWLDPGAVRLGHDIVLAEIQVQGCRLAGPPDPGLRRLLNPPPTPYVAAGGTTTAQTPWLVRSALGGAPIAVVTEVDTAEAGFGDTPVYLARVVGQRLLDAALSPSGAPALLDGPPLVEGAEPGRFTLVVPLVTGTSVADGAAIDLNPRSIITSATLPDLLMTTLAWSVEWIGVQR